jgi:tetratricopeptide (TPR) repeat protein
VLFEMKDPDAALEEWKRAGKLDGYSADTLAGMSVALWQLGQKGQALKSYRSAVALDRGYVCHHDQLKQHGQWNGRALEVLRQVNKAAGPAACAGS